MKSVCQIVQNYYDVDPRVRRKAEALYQAGYKVDVISLAMPGKFQKTYNLNGVRIFAMGLGKKRGGFLRYIFEYAAFLTIAFLKVSALTLKRKYKVIDVNNMPDFLVFATLYAKLLGAKVVLDFHDVMPEVYMTKFNVNQRHLLIKAIKLQERLSIKYADYVLTVNDPLLEVLSRRGMSVPKCSVIINSVDEALFDKKKYPETKRDDDKFIFMFHGTLSYHYGLDICIEAFSKALHIMPTSELWIIGDGPEKSKLEALVSELNIIAAVKFIGLLPHCEIPKWLAQADTGIFPGRRDDFMEITFSNKIPEYIVMDVPLIVSRLRTIQHYLSDKAIVYYTPHDRDDLCRKMIELYENPKLRKEYVNQAKREYSSINWAVMKKRYLDLIESMP